MKNSQTSAMPSSTGNGLTKRQHLEAMTLAAMLSNSHITTHHSPGEIALRAMSVAELMANKWDNRATFEAGK